MKASWGKVRIGAIAILGSSALAILAIVVLNNPRLVQAQLAQLVAPPPRAVPSLVQTGSQPVPHPHPSEQAIHSFGAISGTWSPLHNQPSFGPQSVFLLTDGRVLAQDRNLLNVAWWTLTPDNTGSYINGSWKQVNAPSNCPNGHFSADTVYSPLFYASAVLPDGRFVMIGGEYNYNYDSMGGNGGGTVWTDQGAIYDPVHNIWTCITAPTGWTKIGDAASVVLDDGTFMIADDFGFDVATLDVSTNPPTFNAPFTPAGKSAEDHGNDEEGWTLLPNGTVLTMQNHNSLDTNETPALVYNPVAQDWEVTGTAPDPLVDTAHDEIGPAILRPDGTVFQEGATGFNDIYDTITGLWSPGPIFPTITDTFGSCTSTTVQLAAADAPAALLPDGNVLMAVSPAPGSCAPNPTEFFEFDGTSLTPVAAPPNAANEGTGGQRLLTLPSGQVLWTGGNNDVEIYTPAGTYNPAWAPTITNFPVQVSPGKTYQLTGMQFNGLSQAVGYGDDYQAATNYPLVQITNSATGHVSYFRTHDHSTMAVATGSTPVSTKFDVPAGTPPGSSTLEVIANGIPSQPVNVDIGATTKRTPTATATHTATRTATRTATKTATATAKATSTGRTPTATATATRTVTATATATTTATRTASATATATATSSATATSTMSATPTATPTPVSVTLKIKPKTLKFPTTTIGTSSKPKTVKVSNPKGKKKHPGLPVLIEMISDPPGVFVQTNNCLGSLAAGKSCSISVTFTPSAAAKQTGSLTITDNANGGKQSVPLSGTGK